MGSFIAQLVIARHEGRATRVLSHIQQKHKCSVSFLNVFINILKCRILLVSFQKVSVSCFPDHRHGSGSPSPTFIPSMASPSRPKLRLCVRAETHTGMGGGRRQLPPCAWGQCICPKQKYCCIVMCPPDIRALPSANLVLATVIGLR